MNDMWSYKMAAAECELECKALRARLADVDVALKAARADADKARRFTKIARDEAAEWAGRAIASRASLVTAKFDALQEALGAIAAIPTPKNEDQMQGHEDAYRAIEAIIHKPQVQS